MSSIELDWAPIVHRQRVELTDLNDQLRALNEQYPGERKKPFEERDPMYQDQRSALLDRRIELQSTQNWIRRRLAAKPQT